MQNSLVIGRIAWFMFVWLLAASPAFRSTAGQQPLDAAAMQGTRVDRFAIIETDEGLKVTIDGKLFAGYVIAEANKPYLYPIVGPTGKQMTRAYPMELVDHEAKWQRDHPHHRGLLFGHESAGLAEWKLPTSGEQWKAVADKDRQLVGGDTWHEQKTFDDYRKMSNMATEGKRRPATLAMIKHRQFTRLEANDQRAIVVQVCDHVDRDGKRFFVEERTLVFQASENQRSIDVDQIFTAADGDAVFEDRKDSGLAIRVPASMAMKSKQGGKVINSDGNEIEKAWGQPAKWCDYHGPVDGEHLGIAFLNHPSSFRFPTRWHVREYGLFTANPFGQQSFDPKLPNGDTKLKNAEQLTLKHRLIFHVGDPESAGIEEAWQAYAGKGSTHDPK